LWIQFFQQLIAGVCIGQLAFENPLVVNIKMTFGASIVSIVARASFEQEYGYCRHQQLFGLVLGTLSSVWHL
jgi:hypothetical protein